MGEYIAFDSHKHYTWAEREDAETGVIRQGRVRHAPGAIRRYLAGCEAGTAVAVEATGNWYWIVGEIEQAGLRPRLVHPRKAKLMMGLINKTDKLDAHGLNRLQRNGTLPVVWIPPGELRDLRELTRTRLVLVRQRTRLKNRITATLAKYGVPPSEASDAYAKGARGELERRIGQLPPHARWVSEQLLAQVDFGGAQIGELEKRLRELVRMTPAMQWLQSLPGIGGDDRAGDRRDQPVPERRASGVLCGHDSAGACQWGPGPLRAPARGRESVFEVGLCGSGELGGGEPESVSGAPRQPVVPQAACSQGPQQGHRSRGASLGRSRLSRAPGSEALSRSRRKRRRVCQGRCKRHSVMIPSVGIAE